MSELVAFLNARLDSDEAIARKVESDPNAPDWDSWPEVHSLETTSDDVVVTATPARVLREVEAKRRILALHQPRQMDRWQVCAHCRPVDPECPDDLTSEPWPCRTLRTLTGVWSDHPDYDPEWSL